VTKYREGDRVRCTFEGVIEAAPETGLLLVCVSDSEPRLLSVPPDSPVWTVERIEPVYVEGAIYQGQDESKWLRLSGGWQRVWPSLPSRTHVTPARPLRRLVPEGEQ
jgi:hypothetical protein